MGFTLYIDLYHSTLYAKQNCAVPNVTGGNITSEVVWYDNRYATGAFSTTITGGADRGIPTGTNSTYAYWDFDASRSSTVYQNDATECRPDNFAINYYIKY